MELFVATTREAVLTAVCKKTFSHENCMVCSLSVLCAVKTQILPKRRIYLVFFSRSGGRAKKCGKLAGGFEITGKIARNRVWKMSGNFFGFPHHFFSLKFSTGGVEKFWILLWKTLWKMLKSGGGYFEELILVMIALTVSAKLLSVFIRFSILVMLLRAVVWSRRKSLPVSSRERLVMRRIKYMAI